MTIKVRNPESVTKCRCGKVMRLKDQGKHSLVCLQGAAPVTPKDVDTLLDEEKKNKKVD